MVSFHLTGEALWQRMERAVEKVQQRLERTVATLEQAGIPYAVVGGNAVRAWVAQMDEAAVRTTRDVDILLRRADWPAAVAAMERAGFVYRHDKGIDMFLDGPDAKARDAVHILFADEKVRPGAHPRRDRGGRHSTPAHAETGCAGPDEADVFPPQRPNAFARHDRR